MIHVAIAITTISANRIVYADGRVNRCRFSVGAFVVWSLIRCSCREVARSLR